MILLQGPPAPSGQRGRAIAQGQRRTGPRPLASAKANRRELRHVAESGIPAPTPRLAQRHPRAGHPAPEAGPANPPSIIVGRRPNPCSGPRRLSAVVVVEQASRRPVLRAAGGTSIERGLFSRKPRASSVAWRRRDPPKASLPRSRFFLDESTKTCAITVRSLARRPLPPHQHVGGDQEHEVCFSASRNTRTPRLMISQPCGESADREAAPSQRPARPFPPARPPRGPALGGQLAASWS